MIDTKYGMKYSFPHSVVHIVDNSMYTGPLPVTIADDPSLYASIVVTGLPMGADNRIVNINRSDVINAAFGISGLTTSDIEKYGQTCTYPASMITAGSPVRLMRVTPEDSTYAYAAICVQWRKDFENRKFHVRFKTYTDAEDQGIIIKEYKNQKRLSDALIKAYDDNGTPVIDPSTGLEWNQKVFATIISGGRGRIYNNFRFAVNLISQAKRPANVRYQFITIDSRTSTNVESYYASLINDNNKLRTDSIETSNNVVNKRVDGSSFIIPYINEKVVKEVYNDYYKFYEEMIENSSVEPTLIERTAIKFLNINIFDMIYGKYIYNGGTDINLPFYQVDMPDSSIVKLPESNRINVDATDTATIPEQLKNTILKSTFGISRTNPEDQTHVGDITLTYAGSSYTNPRLIVTAVINQYTGAVTNVPITKVYPLSNSSSTYVVDRTGTAVEIKRIYTDKSTIAIDNTLVNGDVVALIENNSFKLCYVNDASQTQYTNKVKEYTDAQIYEALDLSSSTISGANNVIGIADTDPAWNKIGGTRIYVTAPDGSATINAGDVCVVDYNNNPINITSNCKRKIGNPVTEIQSTDMIGEKFDVIAFNKYILKSLSISSSGSRYSQGDVLKFESPDTGYEDIQFTVSSVTEDGEVTGVTITKNGTFDAKTTKSSLSTEYVDSSAGTGSGLTINITEDDYTVDTTIVPQSINRYIVSGINGSLYRLTKDNTIVIPSNFYTNEYGDDLSSENGGIQILKGSTGFFDDYDDNKINSIVFKWKYSELLVRAYRGELDPAIKSVTRCPAKYLFDGATNTIVGQTIIEGISYDPADLITGSTIFTADEKDAIIADPTIIEGLTSTDIDVKQAMYDFAVERCFQGIPEDKRPIGDGFGLSLHLDAGISDANTIMLVNNSFSKRFTNYNASWDIGGFVSSADGISYTYIKRLVDNLFTHCKTFSVNKPFVNAYSQITPDEYTSYFPEIDFGDWDKRETYYVSGGNTWICDMNGNLVRQSQRTLKTDAETSDLVQESNVRTLSQLCYILQNTINGFLLEYSDDSSLQTLSDIVNNKFSNWVGNYVDTLDIQFKRETNIDGGDLLECDVAVSFRGLILRVPIIVDIQRRNS